MHILMKSTTLPEHTYLEVSSSEPHSSLQTPGMLRALPRPVPLAHPAHCVRGPLTLLRAALEPWSSLVLDPRMHRPSIYDFAPRLEIMVKISLRPRDHGQAFFS